MATFDSVEDYLTSIPQPGQDTLRDLIAHLLSLNPAFEVKLAWNVPQIHQGKNYIFGMSAAKKHLTLAPWGSRALETVRPQMTDYVVNKATFQVPLDWRIDTALVDAMVAIRLSEID